MQHLPIFYKTNSTFRPATKALHSLPLTSVHSSQTQLSSPLTLPFTPQTPIPNVACLYRLKDNQGGKKMNWLLGIHLLDLLLPNAGIPKAPSQAGSTCVAISGTDKKLHSSTNGCSLHFAVPLVIGKFFLP